MMNSTTTLVRQAARGDRVTFDTDEGHQAGVIADLRRDVSNGELHAWVQLDHQWSGMFRAVPLKDIAITRPPALPGIAGSTAAPELALA